MSIHGLLLPRAAAFALLQSPLWEPQLQDQSIVRGHCFKLVRIVEIPVLELFFRYFMLSFGSWKPFDFEVGKMYYFDLFWLDDWTSLFIFIPHRGYFENCKTYKNTQKRSAFEVSWLGRLWMDRLYSSCCSASFFKVIFNCFLPSSTRTTSSHYMGLHPEAHYQKTSRSRKLWYPDIAIWQMKYSMTWFHVGNRLLWKTVVKMQLGYKTLINIWFFPPAVLASLGVANFASNSLGIGGWR